MAASLATTRTERCTTDCMQSGVRIICSTSTWAFRRRRCPFSACVSAASRADMARLDERSQSRWNCLQKSTEGVVWIWKRLTIVESLPFCWKGPIATTAQSPGPPRGDRRPGGGAANGASCLSLCFLSLAFRAKTLALGCSRAAAAQRARPQRNYLGRETTDGKLEFWRNWCFPREEG